MVVKVGPYVFRTNPRHVNFLIEVDNRGTDNHLLRSYNNVCSQPLLVEHISWQLDDSTGNALTNVVLPLAPPNLVAYQASMMDVSGGGEAVSYLIRGVVYLIRESPANIPDRPATALNDAVEGKLAFQAGLFLPNPIVRGFERLGRYRDAGSWGRNDAVQILPTTRHQSNLLSG